MCISIPFYFKYLTGELFVHRWCSSKCKLQRMVANRARNGLSQILNSFLLGCNFINKILYILYWFIALLRFLLHHCCWECCLLDGFQPHFKWLLYRINFYSQTIINTSPFKQSFSMTAFKEIKGSEIQL